MGPKAFVILLGKRLNLLLKSEEGIMKLKTLWILCLLFILSCSFDYDTDYINEPPDTVVGTPCYNLGDQIKYTYGQYYYCAECMYDIDGLKWCEIDCIYFDGEE
jgi:hypothetical protein